MNIPKEKVGPFLLGEGLSNLFTEESLLPRFKNDQGTGLVHLLRDPKES